MAQTALSIYCKTFRLLERLLLYKILLR